jgi:hypothetical protein
MHNSEGIIVLAILDYRASRYSSIRATASVYEVFRNILVCRHARILCRANIILYNRNLIVTKDYTFIQWILDIDLQGLLSTRAFV